MSYSENIPAGPRDGETRRTTVPFETEPYHYAVRDKVLLDDLITIAGRLNARSFFQQQCKIDCWPIRSASGDVFDLARVRHEPGGSAFL